MATVLDISDFVYRTGTVSVENGETTATFAGASLESSIKDGDYLMAAGSIAVIRTVVSDSQVELFGGWEGPDVTAGSYVILKASLLRYHTALIGYDAARFIALLDGLSVVYVLEGQDPDPSIGEEGQFAIDFSTGKRWHKESGAWVYLGISNPAFSRYDFTVDIPGRPGSGARVAKWTVPSILTFKAALPESAANADGEATGEAEFSLRRNGAEFATASFAAGEAIATFSNASDVNFAAGDIFEVHAPNPRDDTLSDIALTIVALR